MRHSLALGVQNSFTCFLKTLIFSFFLNFQAEKVMRVKQSIAPSDSSKLQHGWKKLMEGGGGRDRGGGFSARAQEPELCLGAQVQEGMRDTSAAQITSGVCEGGSLQIILGFEGRFVEMLKLLLPFALPGQAPSWGELSLYSSMSQGSRQRAASFFSQKSGHRGGVKVTCHPYSYINS